MTLLEYLPLRLGEDEATAEFENAVNAVMNRIELYKDGIIEQLNLETATWGLEIWERQYGLATDIYKPDGQRRSRIMSKMRGVGTTTVELIKNISESFINGEVEIEEQNEEYSFIVKMVSTKGKPPNIEDLKAAIEEAKPAHLAYTIVFIYNTHRELTAFKHGGMNRYTHGELRNRGDIFG